MTPRMKIAYYQGINTRKQSAHVARNPYEFMTNLWSCWAAGWNDQDMVMV